MAANRTRRRGRPAAVRRAAGVAVDEEQRRHLVQCCAFFRAQRFREAPPGQIRAQDETAAASEIDSVIGSPRRRKRKR